MQERSKIHPVEPVATENQIKLKRMLEEVAHILPHSIGGSLIPLRTFRRLLSGKNIDKATGKIVELREHIDRAQAGVQAIADRDIYQPVFSAERDGRLGPVLG